MKFRYTPTFSGDWSRLSEPRKRMFRAVIPAFNNACDAYARAPGRYKWPAALRVSRMSGAPGVWEMTWSHAGPDGRATFEFSKVGGETVVTWRRIGDHGIYNRP